MKCSMMPANVLNPEIIAAAMRRVTLHDDPAAEFAIDDRHHATAADIVEASRTGRPFTAYQIENDRAHRTAAGIPVALQSIAAGRDSWMQDLRHPCAVCRAMTRAGDMEGGTQLCPTCYDAAGMENDHLDGNHEPGTEPNCPLCHPTDPTTRKESEMTKTTPAPEMMTAQLRRIADDNENAGRAYTAEDYRRAALKIDELAAALAGFLAIDDWTTEEIAPRSVPTRAHMALVGVLPEARGTQYCPTCGHVEPVEDGRDDCPFCELPLTYGDGTPPAGTVCALSTPYMPRDTPCTNPATCIRDGEPTCDECAAEFDEANR